MRRQHGQKTDEIGNLCAKLPCRRHICPRFGTTDARFVEKTISRLPRILPDSRDAGMIDEGRYGCFFFLDGPDEESQHRRAKNFSSLHRCDGKRCGEAMPTDVAECAVVGVTTP